MQQIAVIFILYTKINGFIKNPKVLCKYTNKTKKKYFGPSFPETLTQKSPKMQQTKETLC